MFNANVSCVKILANACNILCPNSLILAFTPGGNVLAHWVAVPIGNYFVPFGRNAFPQPSTWAGSDPHLGTDLRTQSLVFAYALPKRRCNGVSLRRKVSGNVFKAFLAQQELIATGQQEGQRRFFCMAGYWKVFFFLQKWRLVFRSKFTSLVFKFLAILC